MEQIALITTGGTIAKTYGHGLGVRDLHIGNADDNKYGVLQILKRMHLENAVEVVWRDSAMKDSLDITALDRKKMLSEVSSTGATRIIITHGTDSMKETARYFYEHPRHMAGKTLVLTGALLPACVRDTDAEFNLGLALGACLFAPPGIYIAMNGVHVWNYCEKHPETGVFEPHEPI